MISGEILYFDDDRGIGFVRGDDGNRYVFARGDLGTITRPSKGTRIRFRTEADHARDLEPVAGAAPAAMPAETASPKVPVQPGNLVLPSRSTTERIGFLGSFRRNVTTNYVGFAGRASRRECWSFVAVAVVLVMAASAAAYGLGGMLVGTKEGAELWLGFAIIGSVLALALPSIAVAVRRQHDIGLPGWYLLLLLIPTVGWLIVLVFMLVPSQKHENRWGPVPDGVLREKAQADA